jgi:hypothetical protein
METVLGSSSDRPAIDRPKDRQKSRITNGSALLPGVDGRSPWLRSCKDVIAAHLSGLGDTDNTSAAERSLVRRVSVLAVEARAARGEEGNRTLIFRGSFSSPSHLRCQTDRGPSNGRRTSGKIREIPVCRHRRSARHCAGTRGARRPDHARRAMVGRPRQQYTEAAVVMNG